MSNLFKINCQIEFHVKTAKNFTIVKTVNTLIYLYKSKTVRICSRLKLNLSKTKLELNYTKIFSLDR